MRVIRLSTHFLESIKFLSTNVENKVWRTINTLLQRQDYDGPDFKVLENRPGNNFHSMRIYGDYRAIVDIDANIWTFVHVAPRQDVYKWTDRYHAGRNPVTSEYQIWSPPTETATIPPPVWQKHIGGKTQVSRPMSVVSTEPKPFAEVGDSQLLALGLPFEWIEAIRAVPTIEDLEVVIAGRLPEEVGHRLIALHLNEPIPSVAVQAPDKERTSQVIPATNDTELARILKHPLDKWIAFLHPEQRRLAHAEFGGPAKVTGSAGTGKTVLALHRARHLAQQGKRVLVTTYTRALAANLERQLRRLCPGELATGMITVHSVFRVASKVLDAAGDGDFRTISDSEVRLGIPERVGAFSRGWLVGEWKHVVDFQGITSLEQYLQVDRTGRRRGLTEAQRRLVWGAIEPFLVRSWSNRRWSWATVANRARQALERPDAPELTTRAFGKQFDVVVVDEVQDLGPSELRFLRSLAGPGPDNLFLVGDAGQRIYSRQFTLRSCGIDVRGRSSILRVNYRTTGEIRRLADTITEPESDDLDGGVESRRWVRSVLRGSLPVTYQASDRPSEIERVVQVINAWLDEPTPTTTGDQPPHGVDDVITSSSDIASVEDEDLDALDFAYGVGDIAVFARTNEIASSFRDALNECGISAVDIDPNSEGEPRRNAVTVTTLHKAKGLEFKAVAVVATDIIPLHLAEIEEEEVGTHASQERDLLYVGMTRARDALVVSWSGEPSPFLLDALTSSDVVMAG